MGKDDFSSIHRLTVSITIANALRDLCLSNIFCDQHIHIEYSVLYGSTWLTHSFDDMTSSLTRTSKQEILDSLHSSHFRLSYNSHSTCSCCSALLHHICGRILHLASLTDQQFEEVFCLCYLLIVIMIVYLV